VAKATNHKYSVVATQTLKPLPFYLSYGWAEAQPSEIRRESGNASNHEAERA